MFFRRNQGKSKKKIQRKPVIKRRNTEIVFLCLVFVMLFVSMSFYLICYIDDNKQELMNNSFNERQTILSTENRRGSIYDRNGDVLAYTEIKEDKEERVYPYDNLFSHIVGFSTKGKTGLEALTNYYLIHSDIPLEEKVENSIAKRKNPGNDVYSTLDTNIQKVAYDSLGMYKGACVVTNVKTGEVLAMVSKPDFNPNTIVEDWDQYVAEETQDQSKAILLNRATQGLYPPGSTFKIITALEYLKENDHNIQSFHFDCNGSFTKGETRIQCYHGSVHGSEDLKKAFAKSCNSAFASIGVSLDRNEFGKTMDELLFNEELPIDIPYSQSILEVDNSISDDDMIQISIGQGKASISPMHMNMITAAIANKGVVMKPKFISRVENDKGSIIKKYENEIYGNLLSEEDAAALSELMVEVVENGTARKLQSEYYQAAGKTGSAEYNHVKEDSHAWFTGFAPAEDPEIAVTIIIEGIGSGGDYAAPIAKRIFDACFGVYD